MDHADILELLEIAAAEPGQLDRLMAGDTPESMAVAGHLAGCPACAAELEAIRRTADVARETIQADPDPALRERTLAYVRAVGRSRGPGSAGSAADRPDGLPLPPPGRTASRRATRRVGWAAVALAAVALIVVSGTLGYLVGDGRDSGTLQAQERQIAILTDAAATSIRISSAPDAQHVVLTATSDAPGASGSVAFSASEGELVATATDLPALGDGQEYGCWVEVAGQRMRLGRMYWAGDVWTWAGQADGLGALPPGSTFGVSVGQAGGAPDSVPVLTGAL